MGEAGAGENKKPRGPRPPRKEGSNGTSRSESEDGKEQRDRPPRKHPPREVFAPLSGGYQPAALDDVLGAITTHFGTGKTK